MNELLAVKPDDADITWDCDRDETTEAGMATNPEATDAAAAKRTHPRQ